MRVLHPLYQSFGLVRWRIFGPEAGEEFSIFDKFRYEGATGNLGMICGFGTKAANEQWFGVVFARTADRDRGFGDTELDFLRAILPSST